MNTQSFERQLQQIDPPAPDPEARLRARHAALEEFARLQRQSERKSSTRGWRTHRLWLGGFATACALVIGVSIVWLMPASERAIAPRMRVPAGPQVSDQLQAPQAPVAQTAPASAAAPAVKRAMPATRNTAVTAPAAGGATRANLGGKGKAPGSHALVLSAGQQVVSSSSQADVVDPNVIPSNLLEHMDVVTGGAAATYGSGSTSGLVNLVKQKPSLSEPPDSMELSEVTVTGARKQSPGVTASNPVTSITSDEMRRLGIVNVADALTELAPQNISTYQPATTAQARAGSPAGGAFVGNTIANLRGLDPTFGSRTLTLVDGRRVVSSSNQAVVAAGGDKFEQFTVNPVKRTADEPVSTFSIDVDTSSYSFVRRQLNEGAPPPANSVRAEEMINYFDYNWPASDSREQPFKPTVTVSDSPWGEGKKLVHIGIKGYEVPAKQRPDVNLVLLLDVSGSMNSPDKLPLAQRSMAMLLDSLKPTDTVGIAVYAGAAGEVLPPTPVSQKDVILRALYSLRPGGSTAGAAGLQLAYEMAAHNFRKGGVNRILLATDGDFNVGISGADELKHFVEQQRGQGIYLSVLGFGEGDYRDDIAQALAQNGNGVAAYIDTLNEAHKVLVEQAGSQLFTIAKDVKLQVEFNPATVAEYRLVGYETRALNREDFNNDKVDAGDVGAGHTVTAIYEITPVDSQDKLVDEHRYGNDEKSPATRGKTDEYGYLKIRYKLPNDERSQLLEQPISVKAGVPKAVQQDVAFSTAVAGFAQLLQGGRYTGPLSYDNVYREAQGALGEDPHGYRAEFLQLVRKAQGTLRPQDQP